ncbi:MAG TPA: ABC transporter permease [Chloroflexi bacterium]|jgi:peptide/nickel transport system permease protein|nr:ABC transporter permease [Chloroflexota bacterium]
MSEVTTATPVVVKPQSQRRRVTTLDRMWRSLLKAKFPLVALVILGAIIILAVGAPTFSPYDPNAMDLSVRLLPPAFAEGGNPAYPLGTDGMGRDVLSRLIFGARVSLIVGFTAVFVAGTIGVTLGVIAGFFGGKVDDVIMRLADIQLAFPSILLAISVLAVLNAQRGVEVSNRTMLQNLMPLILTLGVSNWVTYSRMARSVTLSLREKEFVEAARALGDSKLSIMFRNILPNSLAPLIVLGSFNVASTILAEASLSFLGLGVPPAVPTWGGMLAESREMLITGVWWLATIPGLAIMITVISINIIGDWLRDFYDPRLRN